MRDTYIKVVKLIITAFPAKIMGANYEHVMVLTTDVIMPYSDTNLTTTKLNAGGNRHFPEYT